MKDFDKARELNDKATSLAQQGTLGSMVEARDLWIEASELDTTWSVPPFNLAKVGLENTMAYEDIVIIEKYIDEAEKRAQNWLHSEDQRVMDGLVNLRAWLNHKKNKFIGF